MVLDPPSLTFPDKPITSPPNRIWLPPVMVMLRHTSPVSMLAEPQVPLSVRVKLPTTVPLKVMLSAEAAGTMARAATATKARIENLTPKFRTTFPLQGSISNTEA